MKTRKSITYLFRGLALGALMIAATGIYFGTTSSGAGDDPSLRGNQVGIAYPSSENSQGLWVQRDEIKHLESQIARLADAARDPRSIERLEEQISIIVQNAAQAGKPLSNQEIERLYAQIDRMLAAEAQDRSGYSPSSSEQSGTWPPDTEYYRNPDWREGQVAK
jgi:hypothetical protein